MISNHSEPICNNNTRLTHVNATQSPTQQVTVGSGIMYGKARKDKTLTRHNTALILYMVALT